MDYLKQAMNIKDEIIANRRYLHQHPETGFNLENTYRFVTDKLTEMGYQPKLCGRCGITAAAGSGTETILLRADMDALPMKEESGLPFAATGDCAHTCGHDMHTAMLLGAARLLKQNESRLPGTVKFMFQPAEEILEGAKAMITAGILKNPDVNAAIGVHMAPTAPTGLILYNVGAVSASSDSIEITIQGKGSHGAQPNLSVDPINIAAHLHLALQELISRECDPAESVVLTFGCLQAGSAHNIIPDQAVMKGTLRTFNPEVREFLLKRIAEVTELTARTFRGTAVFHVFASTGSVMIDPAVAETVTAGLREMLGEKGVLQLDQTVSESEDFSEIAALVPSMFFLVGGGSPREGYTYGLHNPKVRFNENCLPVGAAAYAKGAVAWLSRNSGERVTAQTSVYPEKNERKTAANCGLHAPHPDLI